MDRLRCIPFSKGSLVWSRRSPGLFLATSWSTLCSWRINISYRQTIEPIRACSLFSLTRTCTMLLSLIVVLRVLLESGLRTQRLRITCAEIERPLLIGWAISISCAACYVFISYLFRCLGHCQSSSMLSWDIELLWVQGFDICLELLPNIARISLFFVPVLSFWLYGLESGLKISEICIILTFRILGIVCMVLKLAQLLLLFLILWFMNWIYFELALAFQPSMAYKLFNLIILLLFNYFTRWILFSPFCFYSNLFSERIFVFYKLIAANLWLIFTRWNALAHLWTRLMTSFHFGVSADCSRTKESSFWLLRMISVQVSSFVNVALIFKWA